MRQMMWGAHHASGCAEYVLKDGVINEINYFSKITFRMNIFRQESRKII